MLSFDVIDNGAQGQGCNALTFGNMYSRFIRPQQSQNALRVCKFRNKMADQQTGRSTSFKFNTLVNAYKRC